VKFFIQYAGPVEDEGQVETLLLELTRLQVAELYKNAGTSWFHKNVLVQVPQPIMTYGAAYAQGIVDMPAYLKGDNY